MQFREDRRPRDAGVHDRPGTSGQPQLRSQEVLAETLASVISLLETTVGIQKEIAAVLRDLAAHSGNQAAVQQLSKIAAPIQRPAPVQNSLSARTRRGKGQPPRPGGHRRPACLAEPLTARELAVLRLLASSLSRREIGRELYVSLDTVKSHTHAIYRKLGVSTRREAVHRGRELALLPR